MIIGMKLTAATNPQLATGPQKWVVLGPTGLFQNALKAAIRYDFYCNCHYEIVRWLQQSKNSIPHDCKCKYYHYI